jgi:cell division protein FtsB
MFAAAVGALFLFIAGTVYFFEFQKIARLRSEVKERSRELEKTERRVMDYREKVTFYETREGLEHLAREQYNLAFPKERVYVIKRQTP